MAAHRDQGYTVPFLLYRQNEAFVNTISAPLVYLLNHWYPLWPFHTTMDIPLHVAEAGICLHITVLPWTVLEVSSIDTHANHLFSRFLVFSPLVASPPGCFIHPLL